MQKHESIFPVAKMSKTLKVSKSGYYAWKSRPESKRKQERKELIALIKEIQVKNRWELGEKRITQELRRRGKPIGHNRVIRILAEEGLGARPKKRFFVVRDRNPGNVFPPNLLNRQFSVSKANIRWVTDITYCWCKNRFVYLCVFIDLYSRTIVGWALGETLASSLVLKAFAMAILRRSPEQGLMIHSDRGVQYTSDEFQNVLAKYRFIQSMSRNGNCWDNAVAESFFKTLKRELVNKRNYTSFDELRLDLFEYLEGYYNRTRLHSTLAYKTPLEFEQLGA